MRQAPTTDGLAADFAVNETTSSRAGESVLNSLWTNLHGLWIMPRVGAAYAYELRQGDQVLSTGRLTMDDELAPGDEVTVAGIVALVNELAWVGGESRLLLEPRAGASTLSRADRPIEATGPKRSGGHFVRRDGTPRLECDTSSRRAAFPWRGQLEHDRLRDGLP